MAKLYTKRIRDGKMTIDDVPAKWRTEVEEMLNA